MSYGAPDLYNSPEHFGLVVIDEIELDNESYQFNIRVVWREIATGKLYTARDSGCSCPSPFEDYTSLNDADLLQAPYDWLWDEINNSTTSSSKKESFIDKVKSEIRRRKVLSVQSGKARGCW